MCSSNISISVTVLFDLSEAENKLMNMLERNIKYEMMLQRMYDRNAKTLNFDFTEYASRYDVIAASEYAKMRGWIRLALSKHATGGIRMPVSFEGSSYLGSNTDIFISIDEQLRRKHQERTLPLGP